MRSAFWIAPLAALLLAGCDDGRNGTNGTDGASGLNSLVATRELPKGDPDCAGGGRVFESGLDTNRNGTLEASEVTASEFLSCLTAPLLRALHASSDAPKVNVLVNGTVALSDVDFGEGSGFVPVGENARVQVEAIIPGGNAIVIDESLSLDFSEEYTVIAAGEVAAPVNALVVSNPSGQPITPGSLRAQVVHAASSAPAVDVYVTVPDADLAASQTVNAAPLGYRDQTGRVEIPAGDYRIRVTAAGDPAAVVYDSGTLPLPADADLLIVAIDNTGPGIAPIQLISLDGEATARLLDEATPASVVAVHASPDAPAVDILADVESTPTIESLALARNVSFPGVCRIEAVPAPGSYAISITPAGTPGTVALQFDLQAEKADEFTAIVTGYLAGTPAIQALPLVNDERSVATETKLRIVHGAPGTAAVDVYLLAAGTDLNGSGVVPAFAAVPFGADTGILSVAPGAYDVYVTPAGDRSVVAIQVQNLSLAAGAVLDVIARDPDADGSEGALPQLIVIDYEATPDCPV